MSSRIVLRDYQDRDANRIRWAYSVGKKAPLYVAPCGSGKTILFSYITQAANARGNKVLLLSHRAELVDQISKALIKQGVNHGFIASGYPYLRGDSVYVASVLTLVQRLDLFTPDLIIIDEAHHTSAATWEQILQAYPKARRLGVTATPCRTSGEGLDKFYDEIIIGPSYEELTHAGYLTDLIAYAPPTISTAGLRIRVGDYITSELVERSDRPSVTGDAIEHYKRIAPGGRAIVFDVSVETARKRAAAFREAGIKAESIDGTLSREVRAMAVSDFRSGRVPVLTSCDLVSEGFDLPAIEVGIDLCPTQSLTKFLQKAGRILRPMEGKSVAYWLDHANNINKHGFPTEPRDWTLAGITKRADGAKPQPGVRVCPKCFCASPSYAKRCKGCGEEFKIEGRKVKEKEGKLEKLTVEEARERAQAKRLRREALGTQGRAKTLESLIELGHIRGMRNPEGWAQHILDARQAKGRK